jgi:hypothetical protein
LHVSIGVPDDRYAARASPDRRLFLRRDPLRGRVIPAAALHLQLHGLPNVFRPRLRAEPAGRDKGLGSAQGWVAPADGAECHDTQPKDFLALADRWRALGLSSLAKISSSRSEPIAPMAV